MKRNTVQKELVKRVVLASCDHPTAERIYACAREELPTISLGTVYRILHELAAAGEIIEVPVSGAPSRFDKTTAAHAHLVCERCGRVFDVPLDVRKVLSAADKGSAHSLSGATVTFSGVCCECASKSN